MLNNFTAYRKEVIMKIRVYLSLGDVIECENVQDTRRFWRMVSKWCKRQSHYFMRDSAPERVVKVVKTNA